MKEFRNRLRKFGIVLELISLICVRLRTMFIKRYLTSLLYLLFTSMSFAQTSDDFFLQGIIYGENYTNTIGTIYISKKGDVVQIRQEYLNEETDYLLANVRFSSSDQTLNFVETNIISKKLSMKNSFCLSSILLNKEDSLGYWRGTIKSTQCRNMNFSVICYESSLSFNTENKNTYSNYWIKEFQKRLAKNYPSPKKMEEKRANFKLFAIYFDYDKFDIRPEYFSKLNEMAIIVDGHSDYRIRITGHTDSDGSDLYNDELSRNRASAIKNYFLSKGIPEYKLVIDFKGEHFPVDQNTTKEGKQRNRRVEIGFI